MKKIFWTALILCLTMPLCVYAIDGSNFDADNDGDVDAEDLAGFAQYFGTLRYFKDFDGDLYSDGTTQYSASRPIGYYLESELTSTDGDCDDNNFSINPGVQEICADGLDNDCDGVADEADCEGSQWSIGWAILVFPQSVSLSPGMTFDVYGQVFVSGLTDQSVTCDTDPALIAQVGLGPTADTATMTWTTAECNQGFTGGNDDEYVGTLTAPDSPNYYFYYGYRFSGDGGSTWTYADIDGPTAGGILSSPGELLVIPIN